MKISTASCKNLLLLLCASIKVCCSTKSSDAFSFIEIGEISDILRASPDLWVSTIRESIISYMENRDAASVLKSMNSDIKSIFQDMPDALEQTIRSYQVLTGQIDDYYRVMVLYKKNHEDLEVDTRNRMIDRCYNTLKYTSDGPIKLVKDSIDFLALGKSNFLDVVHQTEQGYLKTCSTEKDKKSLQSSLQKIIKIAIESELKVYFILNVAFDILSHYDAEALNEVRRNYDSMLKNLIEMHKLAQPKFKTILFGMSRDVWRCDPKPFNYKEDATYIKLKHVFQGFIRNQRDVQKVKDVEFCRNEEKTCESVEYTEDYSCTNGDIKSLRRREGCKVNRKCGGLLWDCITEPFKNPTSPLEICLSDSGSDRSYDFAETYNDEETKRYGLNASYCEGSLIYENQRGWILDFCSTCYCVCDDDLNFEETNILSERKIYTKKVEADYENNYVITGARFRKFNGVVYIQIQQGQLLGAGNIKESTVHWKNEPIEYLNDQSYHLKLQWKRRSILMGDIDLYPNHVLLGLQLVEGFRLKAYSKYLQYDLGTFETRLYDYSVKYYRDGKTLIVNSLKLPSDYVKNQITESNVEITFGISDFESDLGQTTIPFIDIQDVTTKTPFPMSGVGLYYRHNSDETVAGFVALKLKTYDFSQKVEFQWEPAQIN